MEEPSSLERYGSLAVDLLILAMAVILFIHSPAYIVRVTGLLIPVFYFPTPAQSFQSQYRRRFCEFKNCEPTRPGNRFPASAR